MFSSLECGPVEMLLSLTFNLTAPAYLPDTSSHHIALVDVDVSALAVNFDHFSASVCDDSTIPSRVNPYRDSLVTLPAASPSQSDFFTAPLLFSASFLCPRAFQRKL